VDIMLVSLSEKFKSMNTLLKIVEDRKKGIACGIPSFCTANGIVLEAILVQAKRFQSQVLVEATSNQVNQFGGYTGMKPADYRDFVYGIADRIGFDRSKIILGGDHLGPQPFQHLPEATAMEYAKQMVRLYVLAGYTKIHLDTSMRVADDSRDQRLSDETIAGRGAILLEEAEEAFEELRSINPDAVHPVYIIGSEVPIPGGSQTEETLTVTSPSDFTATMDAYQKVFEHEGLSDKMQYVMAVVVQPGVEFGDADVHDYVRQDAALLCEALKSFPNIVFEGHSTDYQRADCLKQMVEDGIAILKVGPALTFAAREALYSLAHIEEELLSQEVRSGLMETVDKVMLENPANWQKYYHGSDKEIALKRAFSYSDRSRYYMGDPRIEAAVTKLFANIDGNDIPMGLLHQYMPRQYDLVRKGQLELKARALVNAAVAFVADDYNFAAGVK